jgi:L-gulonate 3-dehydrogenase
MVTALTLRGRRVDLKGSERSSAMTQVAVIGAGLIGRAWPIVFARAGFDVTLWDPFPQQVEAALAFIGERLPELAEAGLIKEAPAEVAARVRPAGTLAEAVATAEHVQENGPERVDAKQALFAELDHSAHPDAVLASSSSGIPASAYTEGLTGRGRCLVAHPINPPYLVPLVEICPAPWTDAAVVSRTRTLMVNAGQVPATVNKEMDGFALNRLQGALLAEAFRLIADDVISPADLDALVKHGLELHGTAGDDRPQCDRRAARLLRALRSAVLAIATTDDATPLGCGADRPPARCAAIRVAGEHAGCTAGMARSPPHGAARSQGHAAGLTSHPSMISRAVSSGAVSIG